MTRPAERVGHGAVGDAAELDEASAGPIQSAVSTGSSLDTANGPHARCASVKRCHLVAIGRFAFALFATAATALAAESAALWTVSKEARDFDRTIEQQYLAFNPHYKEERAAFISRLRPTAHELFAQESAGKNVRCAHWIYEELILLVRCSADFTLLKERLNDLQAQLALPVAERSADSPDCIKEWWQLLDWAYDHVKADEPIPSQILDRINSPEKLTAYVRSLATSDVAHHGRDQCLELNLVLADLIRWVVRDRPNDPAFHPRLRETLLDLVARLQDPDSGYWGQRYVLGDKEVFVPDLSTTFHIVSYLSGRVPHLDRIARTTLATKDLNTPVGWLYQGQVYNHNNTDAVELLKWSWPAATEAQKQAIAAAIDAMLQRCLAESLQPDGSFKHIAADVSIEQGTYFGVEFLARAGFFDPAKRFWTKREFPESEEVRRRIIGFIEKNQAGGATGGSWYRDALNSLRPASPSPTP